MKKIGYFIISTITLTLPVTLFAQTRQDTGTAVVTLQQSIAFALRNQPQLKQANIDEQINERDIKIALASWLPQITSSNQYQHYFQRPAFIAGGVATGVGGSTGTGGTGTGTGVGTGTGTGGTGTGTGAGTGSTGTTQQNLAIAHNTSTLGVSASQVIYNNEVLQASKASKYSRQYYKQNTEGAKIDLVSNVSKAFYDVLLSQRQLDIIKQDIVRLRRSLKDAYARYQAGVVDKTDYKQATIALNNSLASLKQTEESIKSKSAYLKQVMGLNPDRKISLAYDSTALNTDAMIDTNQVLNYTNRIEYRMLQTQKNLDNVNVSYYKWGFLPSVSAVGGYSLAYFNDNFSKLYNDAFPTSFAGLSVSIPIFQGGRRLQNLAKAKLQVERTDLDLINSRNSIGTEYAQALANYKSAYTNWVALNENVSLASDVYKVVDLQYREGIKTYLDVIVAQTDLRTAQLNYLNALFQLLSSKIDLQRSLGTLPVQ
ncbi:TolC family protein [Mucilaginibacter achroorhodeus]|uniref:TolC family protein n=1 Tax=Mucilaginibacter achroorhodeus TaxID=2599294 RepID=A0A563U6F3_9SPHI|nr:MULTISPECIES: TolC family protein [Mucilaginibacter]QXV64797.1 TolC family protein [Mucilaginibacter sp. 21P]TWR26936.1 TolC family protein [Mucilaginibacter achroorhodeus]